MTQFHALRCRWSCGLTADGIAARNVFGLMPHPERACDPRLGSIDGRVIFESILSTLGVRKAA